MKNILFKTFKIQEQIMKLLHKFDKNLFTKISLSIILLLNFTFTKLSAADGDLDATFNPAGTPPGTVTTVIPDSTSSQILSIAIQSDGKIVAAGFAEIGASRFTLARYNTDGSLDASFGSGGVVTTTIPGSTFSSINSIAIQSDGKIAAGGTASIGGAFRFALARYNTDGSLDTSFGSSGIVTTEITGSDGSFIRSLLIQSDGKIVAGGYAIFGSDRFALARYNTDGTLDSSFGSSGIVTTVIPDSTSSQILSIAIQSDGKIVAAGFADIGGSRFALARYNTDGTLDSSFGSSGTVTTLIPGSAISQINSIAIQSDGKIVAGGQAFIGAFRFALARYNTDGTLDSSFGSSGTVVTVISGSTTSTINSIAIQSDGKIVAGGRAEMDISFITNFALARYGTNGTLDSSFGSGGTVTTEITGSDISSINSILIQSNGKIVVGGSANIGGDRFALARYLANTTLIQSCLVLALKAKYCPAG